MLAKNTINTTPATGPSDEAIRAEILTGLREFPKRIASKFFYDECGSKLFDQITELAEYYPTRTELGIMRRHLAEMAELIGPEALVIEFGTGSGIKTRMLLNALEMPRAYIPIDISEEQLESASRALSQEFPALDIRSVCADYTASVTLPVHDNESGRRVVFFPGSTIGNFTPEEAVEFLRNVARFVGSHGALLIGFDRAKDHRILEAAYNDAKGVTADFNLNLIYRINREFAAKIPVGNFEHYAFFNVKESRIEMHLVSRVEQTLNLGEATIHLGAGEHIITEYSCKYLHEAFEDILRKAGFEPIRSWTDPNQYFEVCYATLPA